MNKSRIIVSIDNLAKICAELVKQGVLFTAEPKVNSVENDETYIIEFTGGF